MVPNNKYKNYVKYSTLIKVGEVSKGYRLNYIDIFGIEKSVTWSHFGHIPSALCVDGKHDSLGFQYT